VHEFFQKTRWEMREEHDKACSFLACVAILQQEHGTSVLSSVVKHYGKVKRTKSDQKEVISGNMSP